ncbi:unnamed protein product [Caenorhabditis nigoni]
MCLLVCLQSQPLTASSSSAEDSEDDRCRLTLVAAIIGICADDCIPDPISLVHMYCDLGKIPSRQLIRDICCPDRPLKVLKL